MQHHRGLVCQIVVGVFIPLGVFPHVQAVVPNEHDDGVLGSPRLLHCVYHPTQLMVHEADRGVVRAPELPDLGVRVGHIGLVTQGQTPGLLGAVRVIEEAGEPGPGGGRQVLRDVLVVGKVNRVLRIQVKELLRRVPWHVGLQV